MTRLAPPRAAVRSALLCIALASCTNGSPDSAGPADSSKAEAGPEPVTVTDREIGPVAPPASAVPPDLGEAVEGGGTDGPDSGADPRPANPFEPEEPTNGSIDAPTDVAPPAVEEESLPTHAPDGTPYCD